jgi:hypothetical protein
MCFAHRYSYTRLDHPEYFSGLVLRKWDVLRSLHISDDVVGYCQDTLGQALVTGTLRHLVTLKIRPKRGLDPGFLDSNVYEWRTPLLEELAAALIAPDAVTPTMLSERRFFVNLPKLRLLSMNLAEELLVEAIVEDIPQTVTDLKLYCSMTRLPPVRQPGLKKLALDGRSGRLNLQYR